MYLKLGHAMEFSGIKSINVDIDKNETSLRLNECSMQKQSQTE